MRGVLLPNVGPDDTVILDTIGSLADTTRGDAKLGSNPQNDLWAARSKYLDGDKNYLTVYAYAGDAIIRRLKNLRAVGAHIVTTSHEAEKQDPSDLVKKRAPKLSDSLYYAIMSSTSDVVRMSALPTDLMNGEVVLFKAGTRLLQLKGTESAVAKYHVDPEISENIRVRIPLPPRRGILSYYEHVAKRPTWLHVYGPQGVGKTTFSVSEADIVGETEQTITEQPIIPTPLTSILESI